MSSDLKFPTDLVLISVPAFKSWHLPAVKVFQFRPCLHADVHECCHALRGTIPIHGRAIPNHLDYNEGDLNGWKVLVLRRRNILSEQDSAICEVPKCLSGITTFISFDLVPSQMNQNEQLCHFCGCWHPLGRHGHHQIPYVSSSLANHSYHCLSIHEIEPYWVSSYHINGFRSCHLMFWSLDPTHAYHLRNDACTGYIRYIYL